MKKLFITLLFIYILLNGSVFADTYNNYSPAGTPKGFYDDIDPDAIEDDNTTNNYDKKYSNDEFINYSNDNQQSVEVVNVKPTKDYAQIYNSLEPATHSYLHGIDPDEYYDAQNAAWSIYPLLRLNSPIYFKSETIEPGYYLLTPREYKGKWYILIKQNGRVVHIIPVYERGYTPEHFYDQHIPKPKLKTSQKVHINLLKAVGKTKKSKRKEPVKSFLEVNDLDNYFISIIIYYGDHKYYTLFRSIRL